MPHTAQSLYLFNLGRPSIGDGRCAVHILEQGDILFDVLYRGLQLMVALSAVKTEQEKPPKTTHSSVPSHPRRPSYP